MTRLYFRFQPLLVAIMMATALMTSPETPAEGIASAGVDSGYIREQGE
jgi:hypothetical protein